MLGSELSSRTGSGRKIVLCGDVEACVFRKSGSVAGVENSMLSRTSDEVDGASSLDEESDGGVAVGSQGADHPEPISDDKLTPQQIGRRRADNREKVRQAARRGVVFGFAVEDNALEEGEERKAREDRDQQSPRRCRVEAVQGGRVVEASFAKREWGVRWRDENV